MNGLRVLLLLRAVRNMRMMWGWAVIFGRRTVGMKALEISRLGAARVDPVYKPRDSSKHLSPRSPKVGSKFFKSLF